MEIFNEDKICKHICWSPGLSASCKPVIKKKIWKNVSPLTQEIETCTGIEARWWKRNHRDKGSENRRDSVSEERERENETRGLKEEANSQNKDSQALWLMMTETWRGVSSLTLCCYGDEQSFCNKPFQNHTTIFPSTIADNWQ